MNTRYYGERVRTICLLCWLLVTFSAIQAAEKEILYWVAPMDPHYRRDKAGKSPMGMDLIPVHADPSGDGSTVTISPEVVQNLGVRTTAAERSHIWRGIDTVGYINYDESKVSHIHLRTKGWIEKLVVESEGERVRKGQRLFNIYSPELVNAQEEYVQALLLKNERLSQASRDRLAALGVSHNQIRNLTKKRQVRQTVPIYAPQNGVVATLPVREGMYIQPATRVMSLADLSSVWLLAEVFEHQVDWVKVGQPAEVRLSYLPGRVWEGKVEYIYPSLDPKTRTLKVRLRFQNPDETLKPNMYANVKIYGGAKREATIIPLEALIRTGREERVIIALGKGRFKARQVTSGIESGDWIEITKGIEPDDEVVVSGQFLIDSEASLRASTTRMSKPKPESTKPMVKEETISTSGVVTHLARQQSMITLQHQAIPTLGWSAMTMNYQHKKGVSLEGISVGDTVYVEIEKQADGEFYITTLRRTKP